MCPHNFHYREDLVPANQGHAKEDDVSFGQERAVAEEPYTEDKYFTRTTGIQKLNHADK